MAKRTKKEEVVVVEQAAQVAPSAAPTGIVHVAKGKSFKGGRAKWYEFALQYDGKPLADLVKAAEANPVTQFGPRSQFSGQNKTGLRGIRFLRRLGFLTVSN